MEIAGWVTRKLIAVCLITILAAPCANAAGGAPQNATAPSSRPPAVSPAQPAAEPSSGTGSQNAVAPQSDAALPDAPEVAQAQSGDGQNGNQQPGQNQPQNGNAQPVGTAAAPAETTTGVAGSRPAGAVIAPAKQRRVRAILISVGVVVAAAVAIGVVAGLSRTSSGEPK